MRFIILSITISGLAIFAACQMDSAAPLKIEPDLASKPAVSGHENHMDNNAPRISLADAKTEFDAGNAFIIDVRNESSYKEEHIKGAVNITIDQLDAKLKSIPGGKKIIVYCS